MIAVFVYFSFFITGLMTDVPFLFTSSWYGNSRDVLLAKDATIDIKDCVRNEGFRSVFITNGLSLLSPYQAMKDESERLQKEKIIYIIGEENKFLDFIYSTNGTEQHKIYPMYPNDTELMTVVLAVFAKLTGNISKTSNIMVIVNRTKDYNNLATSNYENIIRRINNENWINVNVLEYISVDNIIYSLYQQNYFNIISLLQDPLVNKELMQKAFLNHLFIWKYRWLIVDLLGGTNVLNTTDFGQGSVSNNVTIITFGKQGTDGRGVLLQSAFNVITQNLKNCPSTQGLNIIQSGQFIQYVRQTFNFTLYQNPGNRRVQIGDVIYNRVSGEISPFQLPSINFVLDESTSKANIITTGFRIGFAEYPPFSMRNGTNYTGFAIELLTDVLKEINIVPIIVPIIERSIGAFNSADRRYSGLLASLQNGTVDTVSVPVIFTINRLNTFDLSTNVLPGYIRGMYKSPSKSGSTTLINYYKTFDWTVWVTLLGSAVATALALAITDSFYPDKYARYKLLMSTFFSVSSLTQGAYFDPPRRTGGRIVMSFWWLFCLFIVVIWATNYAAILAKEQTQQGITTFFSLLKQNTYKYTTVDDNVLFTYLKINPYQNQQTLYRIINEETVNGTVNDISRAISLVQNENYALLYDDKTLSYYSYKNCFTMFGKFVSFDYGFALPKYSEKTLAINSILAKRLASGYTSSLIRKYWPNDNPNCTSKDIMDRIAAALIPLLPDNFIGSLDITSMIGVFTIVVIGGVGSLLLAVVEKIIRTLILKSQRRRDKYKYETTVEQLTQF